MVSLLGFQEVLLSREIQMLKRHQDQYPISSYFKICILTFRMSPLTHIKIVFLRIVYNFYQLHNIRMIEFLQYCNFSVDLRTWQEL